MHRRVTVLLTISYWLLATYSVHAQAPAELLIVSPAPGEVIAGNTVKVIVDLPKGFSFTDYHVHLWLDTLPVHDSELAVSLTDTVEHAYENVFFGLHSLYAEVYRNDHTLLDPKIVTSVDFETVGSELKPVPRTEGQSEAPPEASGGLFIPRGKGNTTLTIGVAVLAMIILWLVFGRPKKE